MDTEILKGGRMSTGVVRKGRVVVRPVGPWTPTVHQVLRHFERVGFFGAPRAIAFTEVDETLTFVDGDVPVDADWHPGRRFGTPEYASTDEALAVVAHLLRSSHEATMGLELDSPRYRFWEPVAKREGQIFSHGDPGPWNTVYQDGLPVAFIDWDSVQPMDPLVDLALAAWSFVPLGSGNGEVERRRLRLFVEAYGEALTPQFGEALKQAKLLHAQRIRFWPVAAREAAELLAHVAQDLHWLERVEDSFVM